MSDKDYFKQQYKLYKKEADSLADDIKELKKIRKVIMEKFDDEQDAVNKKIKKLGEELEKSIRHDIMFISASDEAISYTEANAATDARLSGAISVIDDELNSLSQKLSTAESNRDKNREWYKAE